MNDRYLRPGRHRRPEPDDTDWDHVAGLAPACAAVVEWKRRDLALWQAWVRRCRDEAAALATTIAPAGATAR
jgi:hypothetical protein